MSVEPPLPLPRKPLPFPRSLALLAGAVVGVLLRFVFGGADFDSLSVMSSAFVVCAPLIVGAVTAFVAELSGRQPWGYYASAGALANVLFILGTLVILIEGIICSILIVPLFAGLGALGGLAMGAAIRLTGWRRRALHGFALLPVVMMALDVSVPLPSAIREFSGSIVIAASPAQVWQQLHHIRDIEVAEVEDAWAFRIGVPTPLAGETVPGPVTVRRVTMSRDVYFDQIVAEQRDQQYVRWRFRFYPDSFPPRALDDHVRIGGQYFDLLDVSYELTPQGQETRLVLRAHYRLSTRFNWYAAPLVHGLLQNAAGVYLRLYKDRAEAAVGASR